MQEFVSSVQANAEASARQNSRLALQDPNSKEAKAVRAHVPLFGARMGPSSASGRPNTSGPLSVSQRLTSPSPQKKAADEAARQRQLNEIFVPSIRQAPVPVGARSVCRPSPWATSCESLRQAGPG